jgi:hypothetical protein
MLEMIAASTMNEAQSVRGIVLSPRDDLEQPIIREPDASRSLEEDQEGEAIDNANEEPC